LHIKPSTTQLSSEDHARIQELRLRDTESEPQGMPQKEEDETPWAPSSPGDVFDVRA